MNTIKTFLNNYTKKLDRLDLELIIAHAIKKSREFVLTHDEFAIAKNHEFRIMNYANRRISCEPLAYILGEKEFFGLKLKVNKNTLIPRPETEQIVELVLKEIKNKKIQNTKIIDIGTGSGNIIISIANKFTNQELRIKNYGFYGTDISLKALSIAKQNARIHKLSKQIIFRHGNLLEPIIHDSKFMIHDSKIIITANLPYLSPKIYVSCSPDIKKYEPKSALISQKEGLAHYDKLLEQILELKQNCSMCHVSCFMEISPEQKNKIAKLIKKYFPKSKITFHKDLSGRWRICELVILNYKF